uniref:Ubiquitin-like domain-containing protein n=1 Tax=Fibrocapsa japonica TaxID=94617 RepID=A0A7S2Y1L4_9STRA|mmetsp:Transcript_22158/g.32178  ORF Transcript_22158/g.32178 Transcript_22158/m.32178 type:complete len:247 (+) Transcript_22158:185-925(+)|eukprot:CAMPEP_0113943080 /NCGR_PEP_ID=MMETSP1339-20121228/19167_1 /TAXON_ID=94617 /ORGANISM="Fibrocapsa japonica" /LENGTH=246 /DNA_ID=CAMNT_0000947845 /DNA_START=159 /DNA_END=899 /DNA_ORIENTATION=+ /assembly_acc=CAM_ASM_000762
MRVFSKILLLVFLAGLHVSLGALDVFVTLKGQRYSVTATAVGDIKDELEKQAALDPSQDFVVLFKGKVLSPEDDLEAEGVKSGDIINMVPSRKPRPAASPSSVGAAGGAPAASPAGAGMGNMFGGMGGGGMGGLGNMGMPQTQEEWDEMEKMTGMNKEQFDQAMEQMYSSPMLNEFFSDPEKLEMARQQIADNPMLRESMSSMPGMSEIIDDPQKWREAMTAAKEQMDMLRSQAPKDVDDLPEDEL